MHVLITGAKGQLGYALQSTVPPSATITALDREAADLSDLIRFTAVINEQKPDVVINTAAYTDVDRAEIDVASAKCINADAVEVLADFCQKKNSTCADINRLRFRW